ncbi:MAG TPA: prepilin-type N-terminal cleavage/methylation domain-containing protein [Vicinamibacterales bacterium]|nr:prepilin-type N-terminal cleavage/methylation domain-containing protein [Vicinamibacterales bacterium]
MSARRPSDAGFTLLELLVAMTIMLVVLAGTTQIMTSAMNSTAAAKHMLDMNSHLRAAMDLMQRDLLQVGQGLPVGRRVGIPNGPGATAIDRPGPAASGACPGVGTFPLDASIPAVTVGAGLGDALNGECTDVITELAADNQFGGVSVTAISADGSTATIDNAVNISDDPDVAGDNLRNGDLLMLERGVMTVLMQVTNVAGQQVTFGTGTGDPLGINQFDAGLNMLGTINQLRDQPGAQTRATRIRMVTYFVDAHTDPRVPRIVRQIGGQAPNAVGMGVEAFRLSYDIADQLNNPTSVRMDGDDLSGAGACSPDPCSENQIRKVNVVLSMTATDPYANGPLEHGQQSQNTLFGQVSLRSMAFVDRYR